MTNYLSAAIKRLKGNRNVSEGGQVYHEFAFFCDQQLQSPDRRDEFLRVERIRRQKESEVAELENMVGRAQRGQRDELMGHYAKARKWYKLDDAEYQRLKGERESFLQETLENYLRSMQACDDYPNDVMRFCAMWLDNSGNARANATVGEHLEGVASRKFVPLINQLSSRLLEGRDAFQASLFDLLLRMCIDHPFTACTRYLLAANPQVGGMILRSLDTPPRITSLSSS